MSVKGVPLTKKKRNYYKQKYFFLAKLNTLQISSLIVLKVAYFIQNYCGNFGLLTHIISHLKPISIMVAQSKEQISFEELAQLDQDLANADFMNEQDVSADALSALDISGKLKKICSIYRSIKPVISIITSIPFIPGNVKTAVRSFTAVLDTVC